MLSRQEGFSSQGPCLRKIQHLWYFFFMVFVYSLMIPVLYFYIFSAISAESAPREGFALLVGASAGAAGALLDWLIFTIIPYETFSPVTAYALIFLQESFIPFVLLPILAVLLFKARFCEKNTMIVSLSYGIANIFLPYIMLSRYRAADLWPAFMIPLGMVSYLFVLDVVWRKILARKNDSAGDLFPEILIPFILLLSADGFKFLWLFGYPSWIYWVLSLLMLGGALFLRLYKYFR